MTERAYTNDEIAELEGLRASIKAIDDAPVERYRAALAVLRGDPAQIADLSNDYVRAATQALRTIANFPITDPETNMDAANMQVIALGVLPDESSDGSGSPVHQKTTRDPTPLSLQQGLATTTTTGTVGSANAAKVRDGGNVAKSEREPAQGPLPSSPDPLEADLSPSQVAQRQSAQKWRDSSIPQAGTPSRGEIHDVIAECLQRDGLTYTGVKRAAEAVQQLYEGARCSGSTSVSKTEGDGSIPSASASHSGQMKGDEA